MASDKDFGLIIAAIVAIVAIVGLVIMFSGDSTGLASFYTVGEDQTCYFDSVQGLTCPYGTEQVNPIWNLKDAGQVPFIPGQRSGTFGETKKHAQANAICYLSTDNCPPGRSMCEICEYR